MISSLFLIHQEAVAREIGADSFVVSSSKESMEAATNSLDLILNTVSANHDLNLYLPLLVRSDLLIAAVFWYIPGSQGCYCPDWLCSEASSCQPGGVWGL